MVKVEVDKIINFEIQEALRPAREAKAEAERKEQERIDHNKRIDVQYSGVSGGHVRYDWGKHNRELHQYGYGHRGGW